MSFFGIPSELSAMQASLARKVAAKAKAIDRGTAAEESTRRKDQVELGVSGMDEVAMIRKSDEENGDDDSRGNDQASKENSKHESSSDHDQNSRLDLTA